MNFYERNIKAFLTLLTHHDFPWLEEDRKSLAEWFSTLPRDPEQISLAILEWSEKRPQVCEALSELRNQIFENNSTDIVRHSSESSPIANGQIFWQDIQTSIQALNFKFTSEETFFGAFNRKDALTETLEVSQPSPPQLSKSTGSSRDITPFKQISDGEVENCGDGHVATDTQPPPDANRQVTRYTDIACPRQVWVETPRVTAVVRLTAACPKFSEAVTELSILHRLPVQVHIHAPDFEILNLANQEISVSTTAAETPAAVFDLRPVRIGPTLVSFDFFQAGNPVGAASITVEITSQKVSEVAEHRAGTRPLQVGGNTPPPDLILYIRNGQFRTNPSLEFELFRAGQVGQFFYPVELKGNLASYAEERFNDIAQLKQAVDPTAQTVLKQARFISREEVDRQLRRLGYNLWNDLIPQDLKELYAREKTNWKDKTLLIVSDEPHIPWELVWPYGDGWKDEAPWCMQLRLTRWLRLDYQGRGNYQPGQQIALNPLACLAPSDSGLPAALKEQEFLRDLVLQHGLIDLSPAISTRSDVLDLLESGSYRWLHVAAHGNYDSASPNADSGFWLQGQYPMTPNMFVGPELEQHIRSARPGFMFNICHSGRMGWDLVELGGWANTLISEGAGLFVGTLWAVNDQSALKFAQTFYQSLLKGSTVADAVYQSRLAICKPGDPTWLAYSVYAHPNAKVHVPQSSVTEGHQKNLIPNQS